MAILSAYHVVAGLFLAQRLFLTSCMLMQPENLASSYSQMCHGLNDTVDLLQLSVLLMMLEAHAQTDPACLL